MKLSKTELYEDALCYFQESLSDILDDTEKLYNITD
jgi:hypothetical protein